MIGGALRTVTKSSWTVAGLSGGFNAEALIAIGEAKKKRNRFRCNCVRVALLHIKESQLDFLVCSIICR